MIDFDCFSECSDMAAISLYPRIDETEKLTHLTTQLADWIEGRNDSRTAVEFDFATEEPKLDDNWSLTIVASLIAVVLIFSAACGWVG